MIVISLSGALFIFSAETSEIVKFCAVVFTIDGKNGLSPENGSPASTAVTMFVFTPHIRCTLTQ